YVSPVHRPWRRSFKIHAFIVVTASVARTLEFVLARLPVRCAAKMCATCVNDKKTIGGAIDPNPIFLLPLCFHSQRIVRRIADLEDGRRFKKRSGQEETEKCQEPRAKECYDATPDQTPPLFVGFCFWRTNRCYTTRRHSLGGAHCGCTNVAGRVHAI